LDISTTSGVLIDALIDYERDDMEKSYYTTTFVRDLLIHENQDSLRRIEITSETVILVAQPENDVINRTRLTVIGRLEDVDKAFALLKDFEDEVTSRLRSHG
jgi:hypothetical protein